METWYPPKDRPQLFEWWRPLVLASRAARLHQMPWPIHIDEMVLVGRIDRRSRPSIWVYRHSESRGELYLDSTGHAYKFTRTPNGKSLGRFTRCPIRAAVWRAGLPDVVERIWFEAPPLPQSTWVPSPDHDEGPGPSGAVGDAERIGPDTGRRQPRRRGHLTVYDGGHPLAG